MDETKIEKLARLSGRVVSKVVGALERRGYDIRGKMSAPISRVPHRAPTPKPINAKAEGIEGKPAFREAFQRRRCLVPVDNFYEGKLRSRPGKQPYAIALADRRLMALVGLWENWRSPGAEGAQLHDHHRDAERALRRAAQPNAGGPRAGGVAGVAGGRARGPALPQGSARALPVRKR